ncbi:MAG: 6-phosphofructokinase [Verrucomicrobiae bacterium]|nr:6-phosphofructokinase [Verrucomicrobiae bacterium]
MKERIGILTGGGDCPGLNAVIRAVVKTATKLDWETIGFLGGYEGLLDKEYLHLDYKKMDSLLNRGGTILGTSNKGRFAVKTGVGQLNQLDPNVMAASLKNFHELGLKALVCVGGDGSLTIAQQLFEGGIPLVGVPKTIDNDLEGTLLTFGFDSAVSCAMDAIDRLHTTAESHNRIMIVELMGRYAGWITLWAGVSGGADVILLPEIPFNYQSIYAQIQKREEMGKRFTIIAVSEGAREQGGSITLAEPLEANREAKLGGIGDKIAKEITKRFGKECRVCVLGHLQRGGGPTSLDRVLCTAFGATAVNLIRDGKFGYMTAFTPSNVVGAIKIKDAVGKLRLVKPDNPMVACARAMGLSLGDEVLQEN